MIKGSADTSVDGSVDGSVVRSIMNECLCGSFMSEAAEELEENTVVAYRVRKNNEPGAATERNRN